MTRGSTNASDEGKATEIFTRGLALHKQGRLNDAVACYEKALSKWPKHFPALHMLGVVHAQTRQYESAVNFFDRAIAINAGVAEAYNNRGIALQKLGRFEAAIASYDKAIALKPKIAQAHSNRGIALKELQRFDEAVSSYDTALNLEPRAAETHLNRGIVLHELKRFEEAIASYEKALSLKPDQELLAGALLQAKMQICDWTALAQRLAQYEHDIQSSKLVTEPFVSLTLVDAPALHKKAAQLYVEKRYPGMYPPRGHRRHARNDRIRIGYFSADLLNHAVSYGVAEMFECHDRARFDPIGFYFGPDRQDERQKRITSAFQQFHHVRDKTDKDLAIYARDLELDIAIDLMGHTKNARLGAFAERCAPLQVSYLGYPATTGAEYIDYIIADATVIPKDRQGDFSEKVVYLPPSYHANDSKRPRTESVYTRRDLGLPDTGFVFCCFNGNSKILPAIFDVWMRLLRAVDGSVLWLLEDNPVAAANLVKEAQKRGVDGARLVFAGRMPPAEHLKRQSVADLFLDTLPYNAHTTANDALWAGLPLLTRTGQSFASRVAASLLTAAELPELITHTEAEYESRAIELANNAEMLTTIRRKLQHNRRTAPIFDARLFTKRIEAAYSIMYERDQAGLPPCSFDVEE
jgi:predicted O-linked N-acetylglucosamine transferase (SPINDLY family)